MRPSKRAVDAAAICGHAFRTMVYPSPTAEEAIQRAIDDETAELRAEVDNIKSHLEVHNVKPLDESLHMAALHALMEREEARVALNEALELLKPFVEFAASGLPQTGDVLYVRSANVTATLRYSDCDKARAFVERYGGNRSIGHFPIGGNQ